MKLALLTTLFVALSGINVQADEPIEGASRTPRPIDLHSARVPAYLLLTNPAAAIYKMCAVSPRSEFETTADFEKRRTASRCPSGVFAFRLPLAEVRYDADDQKFHVSVYPDQDHGYLVFAAIVRSGTHLGENAFGVKRVITDTVRDVYRVIPSTPSRRTTFEVHEPVASARALKPQLRFAVLAELGPASAVTTSGEMATGVHSKEATIDSPTSEIIFDHDMNVKVVGFWAYNDATGQIHTVFDSEGRTGADIAADQARQTLIDRLKVGMTSSEIREILGNPDSEEQLVADGRRVIDYRYSTLNLKVRLSAIDNTFIEAKTSEGGR